MGKHCKQVDDARRTLNGFWKDTRKMYKTCRLVKDERRDFFEAGRWLRNGSAYRVLVEPLDIANWWVVSPVATCYMVCWRPLDAWCTCFKGKEKSMQDGHHMLLGGPGTNVVISRRVLAITLTHWLMGSRLSPLTVRIS